ncbi:MAG: hypothetical protein ACK4IX_04720 [Candidatus Sericytochromatia bacterium]
MLTNKIYYSKLKKILSVSVLSFTTLSCSNNINYPYNIESNNNQNSLFINLNNKDNNISKSISVNINFNSFYIKNSTNGQTKKLKSDIDLIRVYLVNSNASTLSDSNIKFGPLDISSGSTGTLLTFFNNLKGTSGTGSIKFSNVGTGTYYVIVGAYSDTVTTDLTTNITDNTNNTSGAYSTLTESSVDLGRFAISTSGGDSNSGSVEIGNLATGYSLVNNGTSPLNVSLKLRSEVGATIDSTVTITNGSSTIPSASME